MDEKFKGVIGGRHTERLTDVQSGAQIREEAEGYTGISQDGVELSQDKALKEIKPMIDSAPSSSVLFFGGSSEEQRTKSTVEVYGDTLAELYKGDSGVVVLNKKTIDDWRDATGAQKNIVREIEILMAQNPDKKIAISYPLFLKEFSLRTPIRGMPSIREMETPHRITKYASVLQPNGSAEHEAVEALLESNGKATTPEGKVVEGPTAMDYVHQYLEGIKRLREFAKEYAPDRPLIVGFVSHGLILDAFTSYLANDGKADIEGFKKTDGKMIESSELFKIEIERDSVMFEYRGQKYNVPSGLLDPHS